MNAITQITPKQTPYIGQPLISSSRYHGNTETGYIIDIRPANPNMSTFGANGLQPTGEQLTVAWASGKIDNSITADAINDWVAAAQHSALPDWPDYDDSPEFKAAQQAEEARLDAIVKERDEAEQARQQWKADHLPLVPAWAKAVIYAERVTDQSDSQSDYHGSKTEETIVIGFSKHTRDLFPEMRKACIGVPEVEHLATDKFKMRVVVGEDFYSNGAHYYKGSFSRWHREEETDQHFDSEEAAQAYADAHPIEGTVCIDGKEIPFHWKITRIETEHREKYSMGAGFYLKDGFRESTGWGVHKRSIGEVGTDSRMNGIPELSRWEVDTAPAGAPAKATPTRRKAPTPQMQELPAAATSSSSTTLRPGTKPGFTEVIFDAKPAQAIIDELKAAGFRWSRFNKCWYGKTEALPEMCKPTLKIDFETDQPANYKAATLDDLGIEEGSGSSFAAAVVSQSIPPQPPDTAKNQKTADKLRTIADKLAPQIEDKFRDRLENTPKRQAQAASSRVDGERLQRTRTILNGLADMWEAGTIPANLQHLTSKAAVYKIAHGKLEMIPNGFHAYHVDTGEPGSDDETTLAAWGLLTSKTPEQIAKEELETKIRSLAFTKIPGYFPTPKAVIDLMIDYAEIQPTDWVLEPSAGSGAIADAVKPLCAIVKCFEINHTLALICNAKGYHIQDDRFNDGPANFLEAAPGEMFEKILMNPPFEKLQDCEHVMHAFRFLKPGGILVAIMSPSFTFHNSAKAEAFRDFLDSQDHFVDDLPAGSFKESGTNVNTKIVVIYKPEQGQTK